MCYLYGIMKWFVRNDEINYEISNSSALAMELLQACTKPSNRYSVAPAKYARCSSFKVCEPCPFKHTIYRYIQGRQPPRHSV